LALPKSTFCFSTHQNVAIENLEDSKKKRPQYIYKKEVVFFDKNMSLENKNVAIENPEDSRGKNNEPQAPLLRCPKPKR